MLSVVAPIWNEIAKTQKLRTQWARERFSLSEGDIFDKYEDEVLVLNGTGIDVQVMSAYLELKPLLLERDAIQAYKAKSSRPDLNAALPEVNSVNEAVIIATKDRCLDLAQQKQLATLFRKALNAERKLSNPSKKIDFNILGKYFFRCYFGDKSDVSVTEISKLLGGRSPRRWAEKFLVWIEMADMPYVVKRGRVRVIPGTLAEWFDLESCRRNP